MVVFTPLSTISDIGTNSFTSGSQTGAIFRARDMKNCLDMSPAVVTTAGGGGSATGNQHAEARDTAKLAAHSTCLEIQNYPAPNVCGAEAEKPCLVVNFSRGDNCVVSFSSLDCD